MSSLTSMFFVRIVQLSRVPSTVFVVRFIHVTDSIHIKNF